MPIPQVQIFGGGAHANNQISIQDFLIIPNGAKNFFEAMEWFYYFKNTHEKLKKRLLKGFADEGGYWPCFDKNEDILILSEIIKESGFELLKEISIALDVANNFFSDSLYNFNMKENITAEELLETYLSWLNKYPIISIEDPFSEYDTEYYKKLLSKTPEYVQIIGDDLVVTNKKLISKAAHKKTLTRSYKA